MSVRGKVPLLYNNLAEDATGWKIINPPGDEGLRQRGRTRGHHEPKNDLCRAVARLAAAGNLHSETKGRRKREAKKARRANLQKIVTI